MSDIKAVARNTWGGRRPRAGRPKKPVEVVALAKPIRPLRPVEVMESGQPIAVTTPQGFRVDGLTMEQAIAVLRAFA